MNDFPNFFMDFLFSSFRNKASVVHNLEMIYRLLKRIAKTTPVARGVMNLLGFGEMPLNATEEALFLKGVLLFKELVQK